MKLNSRVLQVFGLISGLVIVALMIKFINPIKLWNTIKSTDSSVLVLMFLLYSLSWLLRATRWRSLLLSFKVKATALSSISNPLAGNFANLVLPARLGELARIAATKKQGLSIQNSVVSVVLDRFFDFVGVAIIAIVSFIFVAKEGLPLWVWLVISGAVLLGILAPIFLHFAVHKKLNFYFGFKRLDRHLHLLARGVRKALKNPLNFSFWILLSIFAWVLSGLMVFVLLQSYGSNAAIFVVLLASMVSHLSQVFPITPNSIGVYQGVMTSVLVLFGVSAQIALGVSIVEYTFAAIFVAVFGGLSAGYEGIKGSKLVLLKKKLD